MPLFRSKSTKENSIWPLPCTKFVLFIPRQLHRSPIDICVSEVTDEEPEGAWGQTPGNTQVKINTLALCQCSVQSLICWYNWEESKKTCGWLSDRVEGTLKVEGLSPSPTISSLSAFIFSADVQRHAELATLSVGTEWRLAGIIKMPIEKLSSSRFEMIRLGKSLGLLEAASLKTLVTGVVKCSQNIAWHANLFQCKWSIDKKKFVKRDRSWGQVVKLGASWLLREGSWHRNLGLGKKLWGMALRSQHRTKRTFTPVRGTVNLIFLCWQNQYMTAL